MTKEKKKGISKCCESDVITGGCICGKHTPIKNVCMKCGKECELLST